jgi:D-amino-acid oxidase
MSAMHATNNQILVLGAGVTGLTAALCLAEAGHAVRIRTSAPPQSTTSRAAGAMWGSTFAGPHDAVDRWARTSLEDFRRLAADPDSGVRMATGILASSEGNAPPPAAFPGVEIRASQRRVPGKTCFEATLPVIDMPRYLDHLAARLAELGIEPELAPVASLDAALAEAPVVVNCTGVAARDLVPDPTVRPVRGQHLVVSNPGLAEGFLMTEPLQPTWAGWVVHGERVVLGGLAQDGDEDPRPREADADGILERCAAIEPRLADAKVLGHEVGLRPMRDVVRVEREVRGDVLVVHDYGHGGSGVALSWGCAREVTELVTRDREPRTPGRAA